MDIVKQEIREKEKNFSIKGTSATMIFCVMIAIILLLGNIFEFLIVPFTSLIILAIVFLFGYILYTLCKKNVFSPIMPYAITIVTALVLTVALGTVNPTMRIPFFLLYFYIVLQPALLLGRTNGLFAVVFVDISYIVMVLITKSQYPDTHLGIEATKLIFFTFIALLLVLEFDKNLRRIQKIRMATARAEEGDLTERIADTEKDEISFLARGFNHLLETESKIIKTVIEIVNSLTGMGKQIATTANEIATSTSEIAQTTQRMTDGINKQFDGLDKTISTGKTLSEVSFEVVDNVKKIEDFSVGVSEKASNAISQSDVVISNIELIGKRYDYLTSLMAKLQEISFAITKIVKTIDGIAEKINILSLNASIEAARAGEYGRGFSLVADEVKKLADSSQESASEIGTIIKDMMAYIKIVTESTGEVNKAISDGSVVVKSTADFLKGISSNVLELNTAIKNIKEIISKEEGEITTILKQVESSHGISKDNATAAEQILASVQEQSAAAEQFSTTSAELVSVSNKLRELVEKFKVDETEPG